MIRRIGYLILLFATIYIAVIYDSSSLIFLAGVEILLPLFLAVALLIQSRKISLILPHEPRYFSYGEAYTQMLQIRNDSYFPIRSVAVQLSLKNHTTGETRKQWLRLSAEMTVTELALPGQELEPGVYSVTCEKIRLYDSLLLFYISLKKHVSQELVQLPACFDVDVTVRPSDTEAIWESGEYDPLKSGSDASHIREVREYRPGDRPGSIHWKLSARQEQLMVKEYGLPLGCSVMLGLDWEKLTRSRLELAYSLIHGFTECKSGLLLTWLPPGEHTPRQVPILKEEDICQAFETLMRSRTAHFPKELWPQVPARQLWLDEKLTLMLNDREIAAFSEEDVKEKLMYLELMV